MISIPLHHTRELPIAAMATMPKTYSPQLKEKAQLALIMVNLADQAGRRYSMRQFSKDVSFGGFRVDFMRSRIEAAFPAERKPPELTRKQLDRLEADLAFKDKVRAEVRLTNYERSKWYGERRGKPEGYVGYREKYRAPLA